MNEFSTAHPPSKISFRKILLPSVHLKRTVTISVLGPKTGTDQPLPLIVFQDGQDFEALHLADTVENLLRKNEIPPAVIVGIHANENRIYEYGTALQPDYKGRGNRAGLYTDFVLEELLPYLGTHFNLNNVRRTIAGFSLGGLMALDLAWHHPDRFSQAGIFSGSLWWRAKEFDSDYLDTDRIMHAAIHNTEQKPALKLWFQAGTNDETCDRDGDGIIDSISDTLDCIAEIERKGFKWNHDVKYHEVIGGTHHPDTWRRVMPEFLIWALSTPNAAN